LSYLIKEIFYSIQGEGVHSGRPAVFCRFAGCNLWSGREVDRENAVCKFCDTDFAGCDGAAGGNYSTAEKLIEKIEQFWPEKNLNPSSKFIICTGGEPLLQLNERLLSVLHERNWYVAVETNGTLLPPAGIDWVCVSPKAGAELSLRSGQELKLIFPQPGVNPERYEYLDFQHFFLQPLDSPEIEKNTRLALDYVLSHPRWRLSLQVHKILGIK
jgi:7-carboxy-7-deazaguanine synthase (Cx14CxxC type)